MIAGSEPVPCATHTAPLELLLQQATDAYRSGDYARAFTLCQHILASAPTRADALLLMGAVCYQVRHVTQYPHGCPVDHAADPHLVHSLAAALPTLYNTYYNTHHSPHLTPSSCS